MLKSHVCLYLAIPLAFLQTHVMFAQKAPEFIEGLYYDIQLDTIEEAVSATYYINDKADIHQLNKLFKHCRKTDVFYQSGGLYVVKEYHEYQIMKCYRIFPSKRGMTHGEFAIWSIIAEENFTVLT